MVIMSDFRFFNVHIWTSRQLYDQTTVLHQIKVMDVVWGLCIISYLSPGDNPDGKLASEMNLKQIIKERWN